MSEPDPHADPLGNLRWHWDGRYRIQHEDGLWTAVPHVAPHCVITGRSAQDLRELIRKDDFKRNVRPTDQGSQ